jgi:hypothetical protein
VLHARSTEGSFRGHQGSLMCRRDLPCHEGLLTMSELVLSSEELLLQLHHRGCHDMRGRRGPAHIKV